MSREPEMDALTDSTTLKAGMICDIKNIYRKEDSKGGITWTDKYPDHLDDAAENEMTARYAIIVRNKESSNSLKKLEIDSIIIQSPLLRQVLEKVLKDYPGVTPNLKRLTFKAPFNPFVHRWAQLMQATESEKDEQTKAHLVILHKTLQSELKDVIAAKIDYIENKVITYDHLWTIFQPGCIVYTQLWGRDCAVKFIDGGYKSTQRFGPFYEVNCERVDWDGETFGFGDVSYRIREFVGTTRIHTLSAFPLEFHPNEKKIKSELLERGKLFEQYRGYHFKNYKSFAIGIAACGHPIKVTVDSRIIIDTSAYGKFNPNNSVYVRAFDPKKASTIYHVDPNYESHSSSSTDKKHLRIKLLNPEQLLICSPLLKGYALRQKLWLEFLVDVPTEIVWNDSAFQSLVLPPSQKELILAIATSQISKSSTFDDVISGKGKGTILLLSGGPGIGKTLTAESIAEAMRVPLYMLSAGDLGTESADVSSKLTLILEMVTSWNAVLLLDECDVFLESRTSDSLERNKIVSIFLRTLEYYEGILFLTTNRVKNIDPAFQSRIHLSMEYQDLDKSAREKVWRNFLSRGEDAEHHHQITDAEVGKLADVNINGRQIKNILKTAKLLASYKDELLKFEHVRTVMSMEEN
ncbi:hypothetical protein NHQ30_004104 [Ciborinia camelliae]|nr:hypothetical protein NHQ30_004104 [Ciborinia camelliae]